MDRFLMWCLVALGAGFSFGWMLVVCFTAIRRAIEYLDRKDQEPW